MSFKDSKSTQSNKKAGFLFNIRSWFSSVFGSAAKKVQSDNEIGSRKALVEQLFYDFNKSASQVYWMNFFRGIFFGVGSVIGGTLVVAIVISILSLFADLPGVFGDFIRYIVEVVNIGSRQ